MKKKTSESNSRSDEECNLLGIKSVTSKASTNWTPLDEHMHVRKQTYSVDQ